MIKRFLDILIPRFYNEWVALRQTDDGSYEIVCSMSDLKEGEIPDAKIEVTAFNMFGIGLFPKAIGEPIILNNGGPV